MSPTDYSERFCGFPSPWIWRVAGDDAPIITTRHTVLAEPAAVQRGVFNGIVEASSKLIVMAEKGRECLRGASGAVADKIEVIPHGIPDSVVAEPDAAYVVIRVRGHANAEFDVDLSSS